MAEYTDDAVSGRSVLSKFRHLKDWVVAKVTSNDDRLDIIEDTLENMVDEGVRDVGLTGTTSDGNMNLALAVTDKDGNVTTDTVTFALGGNVEVVTLGAQSKNTGFASSGLGLLQFTRLTYQTPLQVSSQYIGVPVCEVPEHGYVLIERNFLNSDRLGEPIAIIKQGSACSETAKTTWDLDDDKYYLFVCEKNNTPVFSDSMKGYVFLDGAVTPFVLSAGSYVANTLSEMENDSLVTSVASPSGVRAYVSAHGGGVFKGYIGFSTSITVTDFAGVTAVTVSDDNGNTRECGEPIKSNSGTTCYIVRVPVMWGTFTEGSSYTVIVSCNKLSGGSLVEYTTSTTGTYHAS